MLSPFHSRQSLSLPLSELPLRPSTQQLFQKRGFETLSEIQDSKSHGMANLAAELGLSLQEAASLYREIQGCLKTTCTTVSATAAATVSPSSVVAATGAQQNPEKDSDPTNNNTEKESYSSLGIVTAYDILNNQQQHHHNSGVRKIVTFSRAVDQMLGHGIALGEVTEIAGMPGSGKTQLALQLAVMTRLPQVLGGVQGKTLYVDCEGSFVPERVYAMAQAAAEHAQVTARRKYGPSSSQSSSQSSQQVSAQQKEEALREASMLTPYEIMKAISVYRVHDETALLATLFSLNETIKQQLNDHLPVRLVVVDSIAFHFRAVVPNDPQYYFKRTKTLTTLASYLGDLASKYNVAVVVINQMTTKILPNSGGSNGSASVVVPALGESWKHATTTRLMLSVRESYGTTPSNGGSDEDGDNYHNNNERQTLRQERTCTLAKSTYLPSGTAAFAITDVGIRDVEGTTSSRSRSKEVNTTDASSRKRHRST